MYQRQWSAQLGAMSAPAAALSLLCLPPQPLCLSSRPLLLLLLPSQFGKLMLPLRLFFLPPLLLLQGCLLLPLQLQLCLLLPLQLLLPLPSHFSQPATEGRNMQSFSQGTWWENSPSAKAAQSLELEQQACSSVPIPDSLLLLLLPPGLCCRHSCCRLLLPLLLSTLLRTLCLLLTLPLDQRLPLLLQHGSLLGR